MTPHLELATAARFLSDKAVKIRTRPRDVSCLACGESFTARSAKAQYCSRSCFARVVYRDSSDPLTQQLSKINRQIRKIMGTNPRVDPTLKKMSKLILVAKMDNRLHLPPSSIPL